METVNRTVKVCKKCKKRNFELFVAPDGSILASCDNCNIIYHNLNSLPEEKIDYHYGVTQKQFKEILGKFGI